jgi:non-heme chloroperoxidase
VVVRDQKGGESSTQLDSKNPQRGRLLIIAGDSDNTVPTAITYASYKIQSKNPGVTEIEYIKGRGHSLVIGHGWNDVADAALTFVKRLFDGRRFVTSPTPGYRRDRPGHARSSN